jgi:transforming growth factor-beta-induced protein
MMKILAKQFNKMTKITILTLVVSLMLLGSSCNNDSSDPNISPTQDVMQVADATSNLSTLVAAIDAASLRATLAGSGPFTVFAPTNDAFAAVDADVLTFLLATPAELSKVLTYHVVSGKVMSSDLSSGPVNTLNTGQSVTVDLSSGVKINDASVTTADVETTNGVVHIIDKVMIPENLDLSGMLPSAAEGSNSYF